MPDPIRPVMHHPSPEPLTSSPAALSHSESLGTPDHPAFKPRPLLFVFSLIAFAGWMSVLVYWALQVRHAAH